MNITLKLYASLSDYLPGNAKDNTVDLDAPEGSSAIDILLQHQVPLDEIHLVLVNGVFVPPADRHTPLQGGDQLAIWPPVAGG